MKNGGKRKSFSGPGKAPSVNKTNPTGSVMKGGSGFVGRATNPTTKPKMKTGNP